jgi:hypothetical protein
MFRIGTKVYSRGKPLRIIFHIRFYSIYFHQAPLQISTGGLKKMCYTCVTQVHTSIFPYLFNVQSREYRHSWEREKKSTQGSSQAAYSHRTCEDVRYRPICSEPGRSCPGESGARGVPDAG